MTAGFGLGLILMLPALSPPREKAPGLEITIQDRAIELPSLPESVEEARAGYKSMRPRLAEALQNLERDLRELRATLAQGGPSARFYRIPSEATPEVKFLATMLQDESSQAMEAAVVDEWLHWQTFLLRFGLGRSVGGSAITSRMVLLSHKHNELRSQDLSSQPWPFFDLLAVDGLDYESRGDLTKGAAALANLHAPRLAAAWRPWARHLNEVALQMLEFERSAAPSPDPALRTLRLQAKLNVLERFRSALWFCRMAWAHLASSPLPAPLRTLD